MTKVVIREVTKIVKEEHYVNMRTNMIPIVKVFLTGIAVKVQTQVIYFNVMVQIH